MKYKQIIDKMSLEDKIALCSGKDFWHTKSFEKYGIPSIMVSDGPHGLRKQKEDADMLGINESIPATCFPTAVTSGATWNKELLSEIGRAIGEEAKAEAVPVVLGPGVNIKRNPLCGRNFEYFSEDPYLTGKLGSAFVRGVQETGIGTSVKHFAANSQEYKRFSSDSQMDERTLREIYLTAFEMVVKEAKPTTVMSAYNKINGTYCSDNKKLLTDILRKEWGFDGMVMTDWGGMANRIKGFLAGCDLSMPGGAAFEEKDVLKAVREGKLSKNYIDQSVNRILEVVFQGSDVISDSKNKKSDMEKHHALAHQAASEGIVLLKNEEKILPFNDMEDVLLIGHMAKQVRYQGSGSSHINPTKLVQITDILEHSKYVEGCDEKGETTKEALMQVENMAKKANVCVVFAGLTEQYESEGFDRDNMEIPSGHNEMIEATVKSNPNTIVVLMGGSPMKLPWYEKVKAVIFMGLSGQAGAGAVVDILKGNINPSGKLTETWPLQEKDIPSYGYYAGKYKNAQYREGIYVGYRYYEKADVKVRFPFGYGLSYTQFTYSNIKVSDSQVEVTVTNAGEREGAEVVQLYISAPQNEVFRPIKELKGFEKVFLKAGESKTVFFAFDERSFSIYDQGFKVPKGTYQVQIGASLEDIRLSADIEKDGVLVEVPAWQKNSWYESPKGQPKKEEWEKLMGKIMEDERAPKRGEFSMDNTLLEMRDYSLLAKIMSSTIERTIAKGMGIKPDYSNPEFRMAVSSSADCSLRGMIICSCGKLPPKLGHYIVHSANGKKLKGILALIKK